MKQKISHRILPTSKIHTKIIKNVHESEKLHNDVSSGNSQISSLNICPIFMFISRYLVASRDLKKGELLIEVDALVVGPCAESLPICLGCYVDLVIVPTEY